MRKTGIYLRVLFVVTLLCVVVTACGTGGKQDGKSSANEEKQNLSFEEMLAREQASEQAAQQQQAPKEVVKIAGVYIGNHEDVQNEYQPKLVLNEDGSASFRANLLSAMGDATGDWQFEGGVVSFVIKEVSFNGFMGQDVEQMDFEVNEDGSLTLTHIIPATSIGITVEKDVFTKQAS